MKICQKCGNVIHNDNARYCDVCKTDLYGRDDGGIWLGEGPKPNLGGNVPPSPEKGKKVWKIVLAAILALALISVMYFVFFVGDTGSKETENTGGTTQIQDSPVTGDNDENEEFTEVVTEDQQQTPINEPTTEPVREPKPTPPSQKETQKTEDTRKQLLSNALSQGDYSQVQILANEGYTPAYGPLAKFYLKNNDYKSAEKYALKAQRAGHSEGAEVINSLRVLGYYDEDDGNDDNDGI